MIYNIQEYYIDAAHIPKSIFNGIKLWLRNVTYLVAEKSKSDVHDLHNHYRISISLMTTYWLPRRVSLVEQGIVTLLEQINVKNWRRQSTMDNPETLATQATGGRQTTQYNAEN